MYGVVNATQIKDTVNYICSILGNGANNNACKLLLETAGAETALGKTRDLTIGAGQGICQFDRIGFDDVVERIKLSDYIIIQERMGIDIKLVRWEDLRYNVLLSFLFARLKYKKIPEEVPTTMEKRAIYWKKYYNSTLGKGTLGHYLSANKKQLRKARA